MKRRVIAYIVLLEIVTIIFIGYKINRGKTQTLGVSINTIPKQSSEANSASNFKYFHEPQKNTIQEDPNPYFKATYTINDDTLNERYNYASNKDPKTFRIVTLGDSFTYGLHIDTKNNWTEQLEDLLNNRLKCKSINKFEVINLGVTGYDRAYALQRYINRGVAYSPELVIWFDVKPYPNSEEMHEIFHEYSVANHSNQLPPRFQTEIQDKLISSTPDEESRNRLITITNSFSRYFSGNLLLFALPTTSSEEKNSLKKLVELRDKTYYFDRLPDIYSEDLAFKNDGHPNLEGSKQIASSVEEYLKVSPIISCR